MRILILSRNAALYSTSRLILAGRARGHEVDVIDPLKLQIVAAGKQQGLRVKGRPLRRYDVVVPRIGASITRYGEAVLQQLGEREVVLNDAAALALSRDKLRSLQRIARRRIKVPATVCLRALDDLQDTVRLVGGFPLVVKLQRGTQGVGTMLVPTRGAAAGLLETLLSMGHEVLLQTFIEEAAGRDMRAFVVGDRVVAAMRRVASDGDFRANLHRGGHGAPVKLSRRYAAIAVRAAQSCGLQVAGVDMLEHEGGPTVIELNASPGLEGIEQVCQHDVAGAIMEHAEQLVAERQAAREAQRRAAQRARKRATRKRAAQKGGRA